MFLPSFESLLRLHNSSGPDVAPELFVFLFLRCLLIFKTASGRSQDVAEAEGIFAMRVGLGNYLCTVTAPRVPRREIQTIHDDGSITDA